MIELSQLRLYQTENGLFSYMHIRKQQQQQWNNTPMKLWKSLKIWH